jgi:PPOX class probable F420-dependent enzyme
MSDAQQQETVARPSARPVPGRRLPAALFGARLAARSAPAGSRTIAEASRTGSIDEVARCKRALLSTFRRNGVAVSTPVWAAAEGGRLYVRSERTAGKLKRLRNDARVLVAPCTVRGKPLGAPFEASARVLAPQEEPLAEQSLARRYGFGRELFERTMDVLRVDMCFLEITPGAWEQSPAPAGDGNPAGPGAGRGPDSAVG